MHTFATTSVSGMTTPHCSAVVHGHFGNDKTYKHTTVCACDGNSCNAGTCGFASKSAFCSGCAHSITWPSACGLQSHGVPHTCQHRRLQCCIRHPGRNTSALHCHEVQSAYCAVAAHGLWQHGIAGCIHCTAQAGDVPWQATAQAQQYALLSQERCRLTRC